MKLIATAVLFAFVCISCAAQEEKPQARKSKAELDLSTPEKAFEAYRVAQEKEDWKAYYQVLSPGMQREALFEVIFALQMRGQEQRPKEIMEKYFDEKLLQEPAARQEAEASREESVDLVLGAVKDQPGMFIEAMKYLQDLNADFEAATYAEFRVQKANGKVAVAKARRTVTLSVYRQDVGEEPKQLKQKITDDATIYFIKHEGCWRHATPTEFEDGGGKLEAQKLPSAPNVRSEP